MKVKSKVYKIGKSSIAILIPHGVAEEVNLAVKDDVKMDVIKNKLVIEKTKRR